MITTTHNAAPAAASPLRWGRRLVTTWLAKAAAGLSRQAINRRVLRQLGAMSDRELKDIGLIRQDVADAGALSADRDASLHLIGRRNERRGTRRS